jgi:predicted PurR-regulated permease PerM
MDNYLKGIRNILLVMLIILVFIVLRELSGLLLPLVLAALLTILNLPMVGFLEKRRFPGFLITFMVAVLTLVILWLVFSMISGTVQQIIDDKDFLASQFSKRINAFIIWLGGVIPGINVEFLSDQINRIISPAGVAGLIGTVLGTLGSFGSSTVLFLIYYLILLSGATGYRSYVEYVTGSDESGGTRQVWDLTQESISAYMGIKTVISVVTGLSAGLICWGFGLQFALFWGFMAFLLNYIPSIGSMFATILPLFMAIIQFDNIGIILGLGILLGISQFIIGSILDPMIMGNRLRLNTITVIFGLLFWGYIWGIPGMLLSVPLMVMIRLMLERSEDLSIFARLMGNAEKPRKVKSRKPPLFSRIIDRGSSSEPEPGKGSGNN